MRAQITAPRLSRALLHTPLALPSTFLFFQKVLIVGDSSVGKTCLLSRLTEGKGARLTTTPTVGVSLATSVRTLPSGERIRLQIWDTAGQERFRSLSEGFFRGAHGVLLCYDMTKQASFLNVRMWLKSVLARVSSCDVVLVGNKADLADSRREVQVKSGETVAAELGCEFFETSALTGAHVEDCFDALAIAMHARLLVQTARRAAEAAAEHRGSPVASGGAAGADRGWKAGVGNKSDLVSLAAPPPDEAGTCVC